MSVGGKVIEVIDCGDKIWINTRDKHSECAIYVERCLESQCIEKDDSVWWQSDKAYWTPRRRNMKPTFTDLPISRIGNSGVDRPK